jgi:hypothetical protein
MVEKIRNLNIILLTILLLAIISCEDNSIEPTNIGTDEYRIREIVFRDMTQRKDWGSNDYYFFFIAFVVTDSAGYFDHLIDPTDSFIALFESDQIQVKKYSKMEIRDFNCYDIETDLRGVAFNIWPSKSSQNNAITIEGSYYYGARNAMGYRYYLHKSTTNWVIDSLITTWAS